MRYPGGKGVTFRTLINQMPPHRIYIETHLGGGAVIRNKLPCVTNIGIDVDAAAIAKNSDLVPHVDLHTGDAVAVLKTCFVNEHTLIYADPPYLMETRKSGPLYKYEYSHTQHVELLYYLRSLPCMVMISGYYSSLYIQILEGWRFITYQSMTRGGTSATEYLWMNYPEPLELHDYRFLGANFRERERITRKIKRWRSRIAKMDVLERRSLLFALKEEVRVEQ